MSRRSLTLTDNERFLLNHYTNIYNDQLKAIDLMYLELKETRDIIDFITKVDERPRRPTTPTNTPLNDTTIRMSRNIIPDTNTNTNTNANENVNTNANENTNTNNRNRSTSTAVYRWDYYIPIDDLVDVAVSPTQEEITNNTRSVIFSNVMTPLNTSCPITLERFEENTECTQIIGCGHLFNRDGLTQWLRGNVRCPICRYDIRNRSESTEESMSDLSFNILSEQLLNTLFNTRRRNRR
jgi:hypothetical protein